jgi:hypothetical protein
MIGYKQCLNKIKLLLIIQLISKYQYTVNFIIKSIIIYKVLY